MSAAARSDESSSLGSAFLDLALAIGLPLSTQLATWTGKGRSEVEQAREDEGPVTPTSSAFVIWAPIFAALIGYGIQRLRSHDELTDRRAEYLARASLIGNILWSLNSQFKDLGWQSLALIGVSATTATGAVARYERLSEDNPSAKTASYLLGPLAGWLTVASFANLDTTQRYTRSKSAEWLTPPVILTLASASTIAGVVATRANPAYTAAAAWGLGGILVKNAKREPKLAAMALAGILAVAATAGVVARRR